MPIRLKSSIIRPGKHGLGSDLYERLAPKRGIYLKIELANANKQREYLTKLTVIATNRGVSEKVSDCCCKYKTKGEKDETKRNESRYKRKS